MHREPAPRTVVLVPRPLTLSAAFAYYMMHDLRPQATFVQNTASFRWIDLLPGGEMVSPSGVIINLSAKPDFDRTIPLAVPFARIRALHSFVEREGHNSTWAAWSNFLLRVSTSGSPEQALKIVRGVFANIQATGLDPRIALPEFPAVAWCCNQAMPEVTDKRLVTIPFVKKEGEAATWQPFDFGIKTLEEGKVFKLRGRHVVLAVGGPPNSGKSTITASLFIETKNLLDSLASRGGVWESLDVTAGVASLDAATPVTDSILLRNGKDRLAAAQAKRPWTMELAAQTVESVREKAQSHNLLFVDLPGKIDAITECLSAPVMFGGIITNDWERIREWRQFFKQAGIPILFEVKAVEVPSMVTSYWPGEIISGRINQFDRVARSWDSFVRTLAEFILFDILPGRISAQGGRSRPASHRGKSETKP